MNKRAPSRLTKIACGIGAWALLTGGFAAAIGAPELELLIMPALIIGLAGMGIALIGIWRK